MSKILRDVESILAVPVRVPSGVVPSAAGQELTTSAQSASALAQSIDVAALEVERKRLEAAELARLRKEAEERGYAEGLQSAIREQRLATAARMKKVEELLASLETQRAAMRDELEDAVVEITLSALIRLLGEARHTGSQVRDMTARLIEKAGYLKKPLVVKLAPEDYEALMLDVVDAEAAPDLTFVKWEADARITPGGCILESPRGHLDSRIETRLERFKEALLDIRRQPE